MLVVEYWLISVMVLKGEMGEVVGVCGVMVDEGIDMCVLYYIDMIVVMLVCVLWRNVDIICRWVLILCKIEELWISVLLFFLRF